MKLITLMVYETYCTEVLIFPCNFATWQAHNFAIVCLVVTFLVSNCTLNLCIVMIFVGGGRVKCYAVYCSTNLTKCLLYNTPQVCYISIVNHS